MSPHNFIDIFMVETGSWGGTKSFFVDDVKAPVLISHCKEGIIEKIERNLMHSDF